MYAYVGGSYIHREAFLVHCCAPKMKWLLAQNKNGCWPKTKMTVGPKQKWLLAQNENDCWPKTKMAIGPKQKWLHVGPKQKWLLAQNENDCWPKMKMTVGPKWKWLLAQNDSPFIHCVEPCWFPRWPYPTCAHHTADNSNHIMQIHPVNVANLS